MTKTIPILIVMAVGWLMIVAAFSPLLLPLRQLAEEWYAIIVAIAVLFGAANLCGHHLKKIGRYEAGWGYSAITIVAFVVTVSVGLFKVNVVPESAERLGHPWSGPFLQEGGAFWWIFIYLQGPIVSTMFSLLAFFVASAAFRAFRAKNVDAVLLLVTALIVLLGQTRDREFLTVYWPAAESAAVEPAENGPAYVPYAPIADIVEFIRKTIVTAGQRSIMIGIALGVVATSLRVLLGIDRSYLGGDE